MGLIGLLMLSPMIIPKWGRYLRSLGVMLLVHAVQLAPHPANK